MLLYQWLTSGDLENGNIWLYKNDEKDQELEAVLSEKMKVYQGIKANVKMELKV